MREHFPDVERLPVVVDRRDDTKAVSADIKHGVGGWQQLNKT